MSRIIITLTTLALLASCDGSQYSSVPPDVRRDLQTADRILLTCRYDTHDGFGHYSPAEFESAIADADRCLSQDHQACLQVVWHTPDGQPSRLTSYDWETGERVDTCP